MVRPERFERPTYWFVASCSIQLSYGRTKYKRQLPYLQLSKFSGFWRREQLCQNTLFDLESMVGDALAVEVSQS
jgi:hypothetical protein